MTFRHKKLQQHNRHLRRALLQRIRHIPRTLSKHVNEVGGQLNKQQTVTQDVSDSIRMLSINMKLLTEKLTFTSGDFLPTISVPCMSIRNKRMSEVREQMEAADLADYISLEWSGDGDSTLKVRMSQVMVVSELYFKFRTAQFPPAVYEGADMPPLEPGLAVSEIFRKVHPLHSPFFVKARQSIIEHLGAEDLNLKTTAGSQPGELSA